MFAQESLMDIQELGQFEFVYKPSKEVAFCWLRKQYVQLSTEEDHTEIANHANDSLRIWQAAKVESHKQAALYQFEINHLAQANQQWREKAAQAQAVPEGFVLVPMVPSERMINAVRQCYEGEAYLPYSLYSEFVNQAIIERMEAQEPTND